MPRRYEKHRPHAHPCSSLYRLPLLEISASSPDMSFDRDQLAVALPPVQQHEHSPLSKVLSAEDYNTPPSTPSGRPSTAPEIKLQTFHDGIELQKSKIVDKNINADEAFEDSDSLPELKHSKVRLQHSASTPHLAEPEELVTENLKRKHKKYSVDFLSPQPRRVFPLEPAIRPPPKTDSLHSLHSTSAGLGFYSSPALSQTADLLSIVRGGTKPSVNSLNGDSPPRVLFTSSPPQGNSLLQAPSALHVPHSPHYLHREHRGELSMQEKYEYDLSKAQLKASSRTSALLAGFAMVALVELQYDADTPRYLLIILGVVTTLLVSVHLLALMMSTCILPYMEAPGCSQDSPHKKLKFYIDLSWLFSTCIGLLLFLVEIGVIFFVKFAGVNYMTAAYITTGMMIPVLIIFVVFSCLIHRNRFGHEMERFNEKVTMMKEKIDTMEFRAFPKPPLDVALEGVTVTQ